jgi:hypothetical protein
LSDVPSYRSADVAPLVPPHQSMGVAKKHTPKLSPPLNQSRCKIKGSNEASHGLLDPPCICWWSIGLGGFIPMFPYTSRATTPKKAQSSVGVAQHQWGRSMPHFHQTDSALDSMQTSTKWSNHMHWFKVV